MGCRPCITRTVRLQSWLRSGWAARHVGHAVRSWRGGLVVATSGESRCKVARLPQVMAGRIAGWRERETAGHGHMFPIESSVTGLQFTRALDADKGRLQFSSGDGIGSLTDFNRVSVRMPKSWLRWNACMLPSEDPICAARSCPNGDGLRWPSLLGNVSLKAV